MKARACFAIAAMLATFAPIARADDQVVSTPAADAPKPVERRWLYVDDATIAAPGQALAISRFTYTSAGASVTRPFATNLAAPGAVMEVGGEVGLLPRLSLAATGVGGESGSASVVGVGGTAALRLSLLPMSWTHTHAVASVGYLRELAGANGAWARFTIAHDISRLRLATTVHAEHVFAAGRDDLDMMVMAGASYRVYGALRAGVEYVGQDIEESLDTQAEGGVRHFIGPNVSFVALGDRLSLALGPSVGLSYGSPKVLGRMGLAYSF
jgi:hypothetical protein